MISIYLYTKKSFNLFSIIDLIQFHLHLLYQKNLLQNFNLATKLFYLFLQKMNEFLQFYLQKNFNLFSFKKSDLYKLFKKTKLHLQKEFKFF